MTVELFRRAEASFVAGSYGEAAALLEQLPAQLRGQAPVLHLEALVARRLGQAGRATVAFRRAMTAAPGDAEIATNAGNFFLSDDDPQSALAAFVQALAAEPARPAALRGRASALARLGRVDDARLAFGQALTAGPGEPLTWSALGSLERECGNLSAAAEAYDRALELGGSKAARHGRARVALERGEPDAAARYRELEAQMPEDRQVALGAAEALVSDDPCAALAGLEAVATRFPFWEEAHSALARLRWELGDKDGFASSLEQAVAARPGDAELWRALVAAYGGVDRHADAAGAARRAAGALGPQGASFRLAEAIQAGEAGDLDHADALFAALPASPGRHVAEARQRLRRGQLDRAARLLDAARTEDPADVLAWALTALLWRLGDDSRAEWLLQPERLVAVLPLAAEPGEIAAIAARIASLHHARAFPIGQSLRGGTQTRGRLFERPESGVVRLRALIEAAVGAYWRSLPPADPAHPLLAHRDRTLRFAGSWSVRLTGGGFHVAHVHPRGLLSSACYLRVPDLGPGEGELLVGAMPADVPQPLPPLAWVTPEPGQLALFPSYLFHATAPFAAGERLTVAFDVIV